MLKIAVVTQYWPVREQPYRGRSSYETLRRLVGTAEVEVFALQARYPAWFLPRSRQWARTDLTYSVPDIKTLYFEYPALPGLTRWCSGWTSAWKLEPLLRSAHPDVILNYWLYPDGFAAVHVGEKLRIPVVVTAIGSDLNRLSGPVSRALTRHVMQRASAVVTVSRHLRQSAIDLGVAPDKVHAILNGCDTSIFHCQDKPAARQVLGIPLEGKVIVYVGRLDLAKGLRELLAATATLAGDGRNLDLVLIGDGPAEQPLRALASELGISQRVSFKGVLPSFAVAQWIAAADVFSLPSYAEGCPNVVLEALNCGRPVVATDVGGIPDLVDESSGILVPARDPLALAGALRCALDRGWDAALIAQRSRRGWEQVAAEVYQLCASLVGEGRRAAAVRSA